MNDLVIIIVLPTLCLWVIDICEKVEKEEKRENGSGTTSGSDSDSSNYVKFGNYLLLLFLFLF